MTVEELAAIVGWVNERHGKTAWDDTTPAVWARVPADKVWAILVNAETLPNPGEVRKATLEAQAPATTGWKEWAAQLGFGKGATFGQAVAQQHRKLLPRWEPECRCFSKSTRFAAAEHVACHQADCDLHSDEIEAYAKKQQEQPVA